MLLNFAPTFQTSQTTLKNMATHQSDGAYTPPEEGGSGELGKQLILIALITVAAIVGYKAFFSDGGGLSNIFQSPKEVP